MYRSLHTYNIDPMYKKLVKTANKKKIKLIPNKLSKTMFHRKLENVSQIEPNIIFIKLEKQSSSPCLELIISTMKRFY